MVDRLSDFNQNFKYSINVNIINKDVEAFKKHNGSFKSFESDLESLLRKIKLGQAFSPIVFQDSYRKGENFISSQMLVLDFDGDAKLDDVLKKDLIKRYASAYYTTPSHGQGENGDRFRILFLLPEPIEDPEIYKTCMKNLLKLFPEADQSCKDSARAFFGSAKCEYEEWDKFIDADFLEELKQSDLEDEKKVAKDLSPLSPVTNSDEYKQAEEMLKVIPAYGEYEVWRNIVWSLCSKFNKKEVNSLINGWIPDIKNDGNHLERLIEEYDGSINISTLYYHAKAHNYPLPKILQRKLTPGQVVEMEFITRQKKKIISVSGLLHEYNPQGYYELLDEAKFKKQALALLTKHVTNLNTGANEYAKSSCADEAFKFLVQNYAVDENQINPRGINLANGFLRLDYDENFKPIFTLEEHSFEQLNIYICDYAYLPNINTQSVSKFLDDLLDLQDQEILLKLLSAVFDMEFARKKVGRDLRAVINHGDGDNGKDTLREIFTQLIGEHRFTSLSLSNFRDADSGRRFGIFDLYRSCVNWSPENERLAIDKSQTLKAAITGDPIQVERKNKDPIEVKPQALFFFNMNGLPNIGSLSESIKSRLCPIHFKYAFKTKPDPNIETEKKADHRFKHDIAFLKQEILPALLNLLINSFHRLLDEGIDYSSKEEHFKEIVKESNHLYDFVDETQLQRCSIENGLSAGEIYERYLSWCIDNGIALSEQDIKKSSYFSDSDKAVTNSAEMAKRLGEMFPNVARKRTKKKRLLALRFGD